ncbi:hypothetical protein [Knoellia remsis]|uniref:hypothetical protein n=1 Tax=Knoellia remsis TaxID=407159 RepID=UPI0011B208E6|nr:hypothetical protein [Knoellia remsis]
MRVDVKAGPITDTRRRWLTRQRLPSPLVDGGGLKPNIWQRFERLDSAWIQARRATADTKLSADTADFEAVSKVESIGLVYDDTGERVPTHVGAVTA